MNQEENMATQSLIERAVSNEPVGWNEIADAIKVSQVTKEPLDLERMTGLLGSDRQVFFGAGCLWSSLNTAIQNLETENKLHPVSDIRPHRALIVSSEKTLDRVGVKIKYDTGECYLPEAKQFLRKISYTRFTDFKERPDSAAVAHGIITAHRQNIDLILAVGGGSSIDMAKSINVGLYDAVIRKELDQLDKGRGENEIIDAIVRRFSDFLSGEKVQFDDIKMKVPLIAVPTTAGTGSEGTVCAVINDALSGKKLFYNGNVVPDVIIIDPKVTVKLPEHLTKFTGADAFVQTVEAYISRPKQENNPDDVPGSTPEIRALAAYGMKLAVDNLPIVIKNPDDIRARAAMSLASFLSGVAFSNSHLGPAHDIGHALEQHFNPVLKKLAGTLWHGEAVSRLILSVLEQHIAIANRILTTDLWSKDAQEVRSRIMELSWLISGKKAVTPEDGVRAVENFLNACELKTQIADLPFITTTGMNRILDESKFPSFASNDHPNLYDNPWMTRADYTQIIQNAMV